MRLKYIGVLIAALAVCLMAAGPALADKPKPEPQTSDNIIASLMVNSLRQAKLPADTPLYVTLTLDNPLDKDLDLSAIGWLKPVITDDKGQAVDMSWQTIAPKKTVLGGGRALRIAWLPQEPLASGKYRIALEHASELGGGALGMVRVFPAGLEITGERPDPIQSAMYQRRIWVLQGQTEKAAAQVEQLIKSDPDNMELRLEMADACAARGDYKQARQNIYMMLDQVQKANPGKKPHPPAWVIGYLEQLRRMELKAAGKTGDTQ